MMCLYNSQLLSGYTDTGLDMGAGLFPTWVRIRIYEVDD